MRLVEISYYSKNVINLQIFSYINSDFADKVHKKERHSMSDYIFYLADDSVSWSSKQQSVVMTSSMKAEYIDQYNAAWENVWFWTFFEELDYWDLIRELLMIHADNNSAWKLSQDPTIHSWAKHLDVKYHWQWYQIEHHLLQFNYISSFENVIDSLTKPLDKQSYNAFKNLIQMDKFDEKEASKKMDIDK